MVSSISSSNQIWTNYEVTSEASPSPIATKEVAAKAIDTLEVGGKDGHGVSASSTALPGPVAGKIAAAKTEKSDFEVTIAAEGDNQVDSLKDDLAVIFKDNKGAMTALNKLYGASSFNKLSEESQVAILAQCKNFPNECSITNLTKLTAVKWFGQMGLEDQQRAAKSIAYMAETSQINPGSMQDTILSNTMGRLLSGEIPLNYVQMEDDPGFITFGYAISGEKGIYINIDLVPAGNEPFPKEDNYAKEAVLSTIAHETSHQVNNDKNKANYKYFQAEYRAWYVGYIAKNGVEPTRQEAFMRSAEIINIYSNINIAVFGDKGIEDFLDKLNKFFTKDPLESTKILGFLNQMVGVEIDESSREGKLAFFSNKIKDPYSPAPAPDAALKPDMDN